MRDLVPLSWLLERMKLPARQGDLFFFSPQDGPTNAARAIIFSY
jgi:hypothetical protein